jgi:hypothetical protein
MPIEEPTLLTSPAKRDWLGNYWPVIYNKETARKAALQGAQASFIVAGLTALLVLLAVLNIAKIFSPEALVDAAIFAVLGLLARRMSRVAAVSALALFILERAYTAYTRGVTPVMGIVALVLLLAFISGVRGTFAYHRFQKQQA